MLDTDGNGRISFGERLGKMIGKFLEGVMQQRIIINIGLYITYNINAK
jgi:hypothetical protein